MTPRKLTLSSESLTESEMEPSIEHLMLVFWLDVLILSLMVCKFSVQGSVVWTVFWKLEFQWVFLRKL